MFKMIAFSMRRARRLRGDTSGMAAIEFAVLFPLILLIFFGTIGVSDGVAVDRKVTILTRTLSDLISQAAQIGPVDLSNAYAIGTVIMTPYANGPIKAKVTQLYIDSSTSLPKVSWVSAYNDTPHACNETITIPDGLKIPGTYLIMSEVKYAFKPAAGISGGTFQPPTFNISDQTFTRPRQSASVQYNGAPAGAVCP
ncbi:MAG: pilus assembly protein [Xanthobacteraceae bacterium]|nr:pilus assembly protein [Xanthobacteraceae bacterium]